MNNILFLVCIGFMMIIFPSNASLDSPDEELLETLRDTIMDLTNQIDTLASNITTLENQLNNASIIPPYSAVNYAICSGGLSGLSGNATKPSDDSELRCPAGTVAVVGQSGENYNDGSSVGGGPVNDGVGIEGCKELCIGNANCVSFNWVIVGGDFTCALWQFAEPNLDLRDIAGPIDAIIWCQLDPTDEPCEIGKIIAWGGNVDSLPPRYLLADGSTISDSDYSDLCNIIDGVCGTGCVLPDLSGRFIVGTGGSSTTEVMADLCEVGGDSTLSLEDMTGER